MRPVLKIGLIALLGLSAAGCGSTFKARGKVVKGGAPFVPGEGLALRVTFVPAGGESFTTVYTANVNQKDGTFEVAGNDARGLPPGKYRVAVFLTKGMSDQFKDKYGLTNSKFVFDVEPGSEIVVDLGDEADHAAEAKPKVKEKGKKKGREDK